MGTSFWVLCSIIYMSVPLSLSMDSKLWTREPGCSVACHVNNTTVKLVHITWKSGRAAEEVQVCLPSSFALISWQRLVGSKVTLKAVAGRQEQSSLGSGLLGRWEQVVRYWNLTAPWPLTLGLWPATFCLPSFTDAPYLWKLELFTELHQDGMGELINLRKIHWIFISYP